MPKQIPIHLVSYNVNGIRAALKKGFHQWLQEAQPDIVHIQETKAQAQQIDVELFEKLGYHTYLHCAQKKGYSGVATLSKLKADKVVQGMGNPKYDEEGRVLRIDYHHTTLLNIYFPSGSRSPQRQQYKMEFLNDIQQYITQLRLERPKLIVSGDYNICHLWIDIHNPKKQQKTSGFLPQERAWVDQFIAKGFIDSFRHFNSQPNNYSWWSYRAGSKERNKGWRIDYNMVTDSFSNQLIDSKLLPELNCSDHCPVWLTLKPDYFVK